MWKMLKVALKIGTMNKSDSRCLLIEDVQSTGVYSQEISTQPSMPIKPRTIVPAEATDSGIDSKLSSSLDHMSLTRSESWDVPKTEDEPMVQEQQEEEEEAAKIDTSESEKPVVVKDFTRYYEQNCAGDTCLHRAVLYGYKDVALKIIDETKEPIFLDMKNCDAQTALHVAVMTRQVEIIKRLVTAGANTSLKDDNQNTALHVACMSDDTECAVALLESLLLINLYNPTGIDQLNSAGLSCLHIAAARGNYKLVEQLVKMGANLNVRDLCGGRTALHFALETLHLNIAYFLVVSCKASTTIKNYAGCTAKDVALSIQNHSKASSNSDTTFTDSSQFDTDCPC